MSSKSAGEGECGDTGEIIISRHSRAGEDGSGGEVGVVGLEGLEDGTD